jgi:hypothetical protein
MATRPASIAARTIAGVFLACCIASCGLKSEPTPASDEKPGAATSTAAAKPAAKPAATPAAKPAPGGQGGWMDGIPAVVPRFTYGTMKPDSYKATPGENVMYSLYYEGVTVEQAKEYVGKLKAAGFKVMEDNTRPGDFSASGGLPQGAGRIGFSLSRQSSGHVDYTLNVIKKYQ